MKSGSTVLVALVRGSRLWLAWAGDSQAVLVRSGHPMTLMRPHKPDSPDERRRIENAGGCVLFLGALPSPHLLPLTIYYLYATDYPFLFAVATRLRSRARASALLLSLLLELCSSAPDNPLLLS